MGEEPWRVRITGAPGLDNILKGKITSPPVISKKYKINASKPFLLVIQHPVSVEERDASSQIKETMEAVKEIGLPVIVVYSNADAGGRAMIRVIEKYRNRPNFKIYKNIPREDYLNLMSVAGVLIGNSSGGIIEALSFYLPVVNIGSRQRGREKAENVIDVGYNRREIKKAILRIICDKHFKEKIKRRENPYGDGKAGARIAKILSDIKINNRLIQKRLTF